MVIEVQLLVGGRWVDLKFAGEYSTGFSVVREGKHIPTGEGVAIKVIDRSKYNTNDGGLEREIQVLQKVVSPCASWKI